MPNPFLTVQHGSTDWYRGVQQGAKDKRGAARGAGQILGSALATPARAAVTSGATGVLGTTAYARSHQNRKLRRRHQAESQLVGVGKRLSGGSFDSGPSTIVTGTAKTSSRRSKVGRYGGHVTHGTRHTLEHYSGPKSGGRKPQIEVYGKGLFGPSGPKLMKPVKVPTKPARPPRTTAPWGMPSALPRKGTGRGEKFKQTYLESYRTGRAVEAERKLREKERYAQKARDFLGPVGKSNFTPTSVLTSAKPLPVSAPHLSPDSPGTGTGNASGAGGTQNKPGVLVPSSPAGINGTAAQATGGLKSGGIKNSGKIKPSTTTGAVGPMKPVGKADDSMSSGDKYRAANALLRQNSPPRQQPREIPRDNHTIKVRVHGPRARHFDPEGNRQRRLGAAQAATGVAGLGGVGYGGYKIQHELKHNKAVSAASWKHATAVNEPGKVRASRGIGGVHAIHGGGAAAAGGGLVSLAASRKIKQYANDPRNREWG